MHVVCSLNNRLTDKISIENMLKYEMNVHRTNQTSILTRGRENHVSPLKLTDRLTYRQSDMNNYREATLLKKISLIAGNCIA